MGDRKSEYDSSFDDAFSRLCKAAADPQRTRVTVRAPDLRLLLMEMVHRK